MEIGTKFSKYSIVSKCSNEEMTNTLETTWILIDGALNRFRVNYERSKLVMKEFLATQKIHPVKGPVRLHIKTWIVIRKHRTVERILKRLQKDNAPESHPTSLVHTSFRIRFTDLVHFHRLNLFVDTNPQFSAHKTQ